MRQKNSNFLSFFLKPLQIIGLFILLLLIAIRIYDPQLIQTIRLSTFDYYQVLKPREYTPQPVTIIDIDEQSLRDFGQWPWPRSRIADLIDGIAERGGAATGFDIIFAELDRLSPAQIAKDNSGLGPELRTKLQALPDNEILMASAMRKHSVVLGQSSIRNERDADKVPKEIKAIGFAQIGEDPKPYLRKSTFVDLVQNLKTLQDAASGFGIFSIQPEVDGIVRRIPLISLVRDQIRLALSTELLRVATGKESFAIKTNEAGIEGVIVAGNLIETDWSGQVWPYFSHQNPNRYISAGSILNGSANLERIAGHMLLVGTSAVGLEDYRPTPLGQQMPGVEIHAQLIENILTNEFLKRPVFYSIAEILMILVAGIAVIIFVSRLGGVSASASIALLVFLMIAFSWWNFSSNQLLLDATYPTLVIFLLFSFTITAKYMREEKEKQQVRSAFGQYLSPSLVDQLTQDPEKLVLGGETKELSLLFCDVRGFTAISESYRDNPQGLTQLMNTFMTELSIPILENNGTIDKYMGDAVMAFWNAPIDENEHAFKASKAGLDMVNAINAMNESYKAENFEDQNTQYDAIKIGIGINTGDCVVGNMGSKMRFDYTALGDTVNIAARLEGQSKPYGVPIIIGERTAELLNNKLAIYEVDLVRVKGKEQPIHIFALIGDEALASSQSFVAFKALNASMLSSYRLQDWQSALDAMEMLQSLNKGLSLPLDDYFFIYQARIEEFKINPPGKYWEGIYTAETK